MKNIYNSLTALFILTIFLFTLNFLKEEKKIYYDGEQNFGRNERSTPRTFVLPATPAVAFIQEKKKELWRNEFIIKKCMLRLYDLGYELNNFENMDDISIFIAIIRYQKLNNLVVTGKFNVLTSKKLGCDV